MVLENLIAYAVTLGLPLWLVVEEIRNRAGPGRKAEAAAAAAAPALKRRTAEGAPARAHVSAA